MPRQKVTAAADYARQAADRRQTVMVYVIALAGNSSGQSNADEIIEAIEAQGWWLEHVTAPWEFVMVAVFRPR
jgi:hypothetical protein